MVGREGETRGALLGKGLLALLAFSVVVPWLLRPWFLAGDLLPASELSLGMMEDTDLYLNIWILSWVARAATELSSELFGGNIFFPAANAIAGSENMLAHLPVTAAVWMATGQALAVFKAMVFESFVLSGLAMWAFVYFHTRSFAAALLAGAAFTFAPWRVQNIPHPQYLGFQYLPLALLGVDLWLDSGRKRALLVLSAGLALQALACLYLGLFTFLVVPLYILVRLAQQPTGRLRATIGLLLAGVAGVVLAAPVALPYLAARASGMISAYEIGVSGDWSFEPWWYLGTPFLHRVGAPLLLLIAGDLLLRLVGRWQGRPRPLARAEIALWAIALWALWLSAGPDPHLPGGLPLPTPYGLLQAIVPGFGELRGPGRFFMVVAAALAGIGGFAAARLLARAGAGGAALFTLVGLAAFAVAGARAPAHVVAAGLGESRKAVYDLLAQAPPGGPILELPATATERDIVGDHRNARYMLASTLHWRPLLGGMTGHNPPVAAFYNAIVRRLPAPDALAALTRVVEVDRLVLHRDEFLPYRGFEEALWAGELPAGLASEVRIDSTEVFRVTQKAPSGWRATLERQMQGEAQQSFDGISVSPLAPACRQARIESVDAPTVVAMVPVPIVIPVVFRNQSACAWPGFAVHPTGLVGLSYRWVDPAGNEILYPAPAFSPLIADIRPGERVASSVVVQPVGGPDGEWTLRIELVQWGSGDPLATAEVIVEARAFAAGPVGPDPLPGS
ncbi:MAG: hypothetical protein VCC00_10470 [Deltaproteobacteria bacterium]